VSTVAVTPQTGAGAEELGAGIGFEDVSKVFVSAESDAFTAIESIDLTIEPGTFVTIVGPSGCGKSTLLNMAAGLLKPSSGTVRYRGSPVTGVNTDVGYMTQKDNLLPWRRVEDNVRLPLEMPGHHRSRAEKTAMVEAQLARVGLEKFGRRYPAELSGGMRKRVALARSLVYDPATLLMDEPFGALDAQLRLSLQGQLLELLRRDRKTVLFVTHDIEEAVMLADRVVVFGANPGRIVHVEDVHLDRSGDLVAARRSPEVAEICGRLWSMLETHEETPDGDR
jgi:NitT/TauT family transport system ATP-binding protein